MRKMGKIISFLSAALLISCLVSCSDNDDNNGSSQPRLSNFSNSGCKKFASDGTSSAMSRAANAVAAASNSQSEQIVLAALGINKLRIVHENALLSCEAVIATDFKIEGPTITLTEKSTNDVNCLCYYDLSFTIDNLPSGNYNIIINRQTINRDGKAKSGESKYCEFSVDFSGSLSQTIKL